LAVTVLVPHGMAWCADGRRIVQAEGSTLRAVWTDLHRSFPELMWRISLEQGPPGFWVRIFIDGEPAQRENYDVEVPDGAVISLHVIPGAGLGRSG
jgi:hypothetical protein